MNNKLDTIEEKISSLKTQQKLLKLNYKEKEDCKKLIESQ